MITNEVPAPILYGYIPIPRHIRKGVLIRRIIESHFCTAVGGQQFRKESRKLQMRIKIERYYSFFHYCLLSCRYVMLQIRVLNKPKWGASPPLPRSDGTGPSEH